MIDIGKLKELLKELSKPKKYEVGYVDARRVVSDGLAILGLDATDILGFAKEETDTRIRRVKGAQAWFKRMYEDGWRLASQFEYEGLLYNGFVVMERELPNKRLQELIETLDDERVVRTGSAMELDRGPELPEVKPKKEPVHYPYGVQEIEEEKKEIEKATEPVEGFTDDILDIIGKSQEDMKSLEDLFFDETGKRAIWKGKETKAFKEWKENRD